MFHSAALKLTIWYLGLIMLISIIFSGVIYHISYSTLSRDVHHQNDFVRTQLTPYDFRDYSTARETQLNQERNQLINRLVLFNLLVLIGGGALSYLLARRTLEPIEASLDTQSRFTADASHELRTPLTAMQTEIEVALRDPNLTKKEAITQLESSLEEVQKLKALSDGLLRLASTDGQLQMSQKVALAPLIEQAIEKWHKIAQIKNIKITKDIKPVSVRGDSQSLVDLLSIFIDNAIKYSEPETEITIKSNYKDDIAIIKIQDKGQGIEASELPRIFDRFYRTDSSRTKENAGGYGLGLAIAKKIVDLHHGSIEVASAPGKGSAFTISIPKV
jgi:two-component system sensor histidine kinase CiaH